MLLRLAQFWKKLFGIVFIKRDLVSGSERMELGKWNRNKETKITRIETRF